MAFDGVPIGNIPAQLAASVIGIPNKSGFIPMASANAETTGANTITCATLLITSLMKSKTVTTTSTKIKPLPENYCRI